MEINWVELFTPALKVILEQGVSFIVLAGVVLYFGWAMERQMKRYDKLQENLLLMAQKGFDAMNENTKVLAQLGSKIDAEKNH